MDRPVDFADPSYDSVLTAEQREQLWSLHPDGRARFWGATPAHDRKFKDVARGDVVLFTGQGQVRAIGEVGAVFRNRALADLLWPPRSGEAGWHTVYSLTDVVPADIPYEELNTSLGYRPAHNFPGQMVLHGDKARSVLEDFMITPGAGEPLLPQQFTAEVSDPVRIAALEELRTHRTGYRRSPRLIVVDRREARLVREYRRHLTARGVTATRFYCPSGISDMYVVTDGEPEVIEAKSTAGHRHVRQALAQLLDYAPHSPSPAGRLSALFPELPDHGDVGLLHRYGIDCVHRDPAQGFRRLPAPGDRRELMRGLWSTTPATASAG
ncbi:hypothetical protein [Streptomyces longwoodensis]|uniref:hypothetical protein n=1 Tax=Streptomyces longwoodensis TaxID=68231 RepID=UPI0036EEC2AC